MSVLSFLSRAASEARARFRALLRRGDAEREMDEEMRFHVEMQAAKLEREGMDAACARRAALLAFGGSERFKEEVRDARGGQTVHDLVRDVRRALRSLRAARAYTVAVIASLALGIGTTTAIAVLVNSVLLRPLPYPDADRIVAVGHVAPGYGEDATGQSAGTFLHYREHSRAFAALGAYWENDISMTDLEEPERIHVAMTTTGVFAVLGVPAALGRVFVEEDATRNHVLISHDLWMRRYGGDPQIIGRQIETNRTPDIVVGVMPQGFAFPAPGTQLWYATEIEGTRASLRDLFMQAIGRLAPGVTADEARRDLERLVPTLSDAYPDATPEALAESGLQPTVAPLADVMVRGVRHRLVMLLWAAAFVLLVAWANVATLALVRAERQRREMAIARALGAPRGRILRLVLVEGLVLAVGGAGLGVALALLGARWGYGLGPANIPRLHEIRADHTTLLLAAALAGASVVVIAAAAMVRAIRAHDVNETLRGGTRVSASREALRVQRGLVALQTALALTLLIAAASMTRSFLELRRAELGFVPENLLAFEINPPARYLRYAAAAGVHDELLTRLRNEPGVDGAEVVMRAPLLPEIAYLRESLEGEGMGARAGAQASAMVNFASPGYFRLMGIPLLQGRTFARGDLLGEAPPVVLSASAARALFGGAPAINERVRLVGKPQYPAYEVVGVVGDVPGARVADGPATAFYFPVLDDLRDQPEARLPMPYIPREASIVVRTSVPPLSVIPTARRALREVDAKIPLAQPRAMVRSVEASMAPLRLTSLLLGGAAAATLFLGVVGLYGVVSYSVSLRGGEFGVRIALGATPAALRRMVVRQGAAVATAGIVAGLALAAMTMRWLRALLYGVDATDPLLFGAVAGVLLGIALAASWLPARRAAATDPAAALRAE